MAHRHVCHGLFEHHIGRQFCIPVKQTTLKFYLDLASVNYACFYRPRYEINFINSNPQLDGTKKY